MTDKKERTLVLIKPEGVIRQLTGKIISRFEDAGLKIIGLKMIWADKEVAKKHYREDIAQKYGEEVRERLLEHITEGPVLAIVLEGPDGIAVTRKLVGSTYPNEALPGTIRGDFGHVSKLYANAKETSVRNFVHASANPEDAQVEIPLWFTEDEFHSYKTAHDIICLKE